MTAGHRSVLAGAAINSPSGGAPLQRLFRPPDEAATRTLTPSVTIACPGRAFARPFTPPRPRPQRMPPTGLGPTGETRSPDPPLPSTRQRRRLQTDQGAFHRRVPLYIESLLSQGLERPATESTALPPRIGFRRSFTLPSGGARPSCRSLLLLSGGSRGDSLFWRERREDGSGQRRSSTSAT